MDINTLYTSVTEPKLVSKRNGRSTMYYVPYNIAEVDGTFTCYYVPLTPDNYNYGGLVDAIIGVKYSLGNTLAILNNYMSDSKNTKYKNEFLELQDWRKYAKIEAKKHFNL